MRHLLFTLLGASVLVAATPAVAKPAKPKPALITPAAANAPKKAGKARARVAALALPPAPSLDLGLQFQPGLRRLAGLARLRLTPAQWQGDSAHFSLEHGLVVTHVTLNGKPVDFDRDDRGLTVALPKGQKPNPRAVLGISYVGRPSEVANGLATQDVAPEGLLLGPDGHWFPQPDGDLPLATSASLRLPEGWRPSGPGVKATFEARRGLYHLTFARGKKPVIAAAPYAITTSGDTTCYTTGDAGGVSLAAGEALVKLYGVHGIAAPVPDTLVELPAGFAPLGLDGWLAAPRPGSAVGTWLAGLAWLPHAGSLGSARNWLTASLVAYSADLAEGQAHGQAAYAKALKTRLTSYEEFLRRTPLKDVSLNGALAPSDPAWGPVVEDKGALVWALVHDELGDKAFWQLLGAHHAALEAGTASLSTLLEAGGRHLDFVNSWLEQPGLPHFRLADVHVEGEPGAYQVTGALEASGPVFETPLELALIEQTGVERLGFQTFGAHVPFHFVSPTRPLRLMVDPSERLPLARERQLSIARSLARPDLVVVYGTGGASTEADANREAALELAHQLKPHGGEPPVVADTALTSAQRHGALALVGRPSSHALVSSWEDQLPVRFLEQGKALWWQGRSFQGPKDGVVQAIANPDQPDAPVVVVAALSVAALADGLHYLDRDTTFCVYDGQAVVEEGDALRTFPELEAVLY